MSKLTSGQSVKDNTGLLQVGVQVLLAHLPNIDRLAGFLFLLLFSILHCIFDSNVKCFVSINCFSFL